MTIVGDKRPILGIWFTSGIGYEVGTNGVTVIEAYNEPGVGGFMPFYAVRRGTFIEARIPAWMVVVTYQEPKA